MKLGVLVLFPATFSALKKVLRKTTKHAVSADFTLSDNVYMCTRKCSRNSSCNLYQNARNGLIALGRLNHPRLPHRMRKH
jgi:hypothetical protein